MGVEGDVKCMAESLGCLVGVVSGWGGRGIVQLACPSEGLEGYIKKAIFSFGLGPNRRIFKKALRWPKKNIFLNCTNLHAFAGSEEQEVLI